jgi:SOS-response transcriptional repressor LexA
MTRNRIAFNAECTDRALRYISTHTVEHGCPPTVREIGSFVGYSSSSSSHMLVQYLLAHRYIDMYSKIPRSIRLTDGGYERIKETVSNPHNKEIAGLLPTAMAYWSQELFAAGWLVDLDRELPKMIPEIANAARAIGRIPTYFDGEKIEWRNYPDEMD